MGDEVQDFFKFALVVAQEAGEVGSHRFRQTKILSVKLSIFSYPSVLTYVLGAQKNHLIETVLLSTHNIGFG